MSTPGTTPVSSSASSLYDSRNDASTEESVYFASSNPSVAATSHFGMTPSPGPDLAASTTACDLRQLFDENIFAKMCRVAEDSLRRSAALANHEGVHVDKEDVVMVHPIVFPEYCPQHGTEAGIYTLREAEFWTCGFFPGTLYSLLERAIRHPQSLHLSNENGSSREQLRAHLMSICRTWSEPLHHMAGRTDTHDLGFIIMPALRQDWELTSNPQSLASIVRAAHSLATRYVPSARAIRSWDMMKKKDVEITGVEENLIVIIDSMCNLELLYYAAAHAGEARLANIATSHAQTLINTHLRPESVKSRDKTGYTGQLYSTWHVANLDPMTGEVKRRLTAQGYADSSTWARGQSWAVLGYAQAYMWTKNTTFLFAACGVAEYFLYRLKTALACVDMHPVHDLGAVPTRLTGRSTGRMVPLWDFDAPIGDESNPIRDSSAGVIAANGMLVLSQGLAGAGYTALATRFRDAAIEIIQDSLNFALARETVRFKAGGELETEDVMATGRFDALLKYGTANNNSNARRRYADHGLVYGDYYLVEFGNRLLRMGLM